MIRAAVAAAAATSCRGHLPLAAPPLGAPRHAVLVAKAVVHTACMRWSGLPRSPPHCPATAVLLPDQVLAVVRSGLLRSPLFFAPPRPPGWIPWLDTLARYPGWIPWLDTLARYPGEIPWRDILAGYRGGAHISHSMFGHSSTVSLAGLPTPGMAELVTTGQPS